MPDNDPLNPEPGMCVTYTRSFSPEEVATFARISNDDNPIHLDEDFAARSIFGKRVVHGILVTSMFSKIFGTIYPGNGGIYLSQNTKFLKPVFVNMEITARVELISFEADSRKGLFSTEILDQNDRLMAVGEAKILFPPAMS